jgi:hypothetical protein
MAFIKHQPDDSILMQGTFRLNSSFLVKADGTEAFSANQSMGGFRFTNVGAPLVGTDGTNKDYVDNFILGLSWKTACRAATTTNIVLSGLLVIDGVTLVAGDRVLVKDQTLQKDNGIYVAAAGAWSRSTDTDTSVKLESATVAAEEGTLNSDTRWTQTNDNFILGTDPVTWVFIGKGSGVKPATLVVAPLPSDGDYTDIQSAINALPAAGGLIFVREGTYFPTSTIVMPDKSVMIRGCGSSTVIDLTLAGGNPAFSFAGISSNRIFGFADLKITGNGTLGQNFVQVASTTTIFVHNVEVAVFIDKLVKVTGGNPTLWFSDCPALIISGQMWNGAGTFRISNSFIQSSSTNPISGSPLVISSDSDVFANNGGTTMLLAASSSFVGGKLNVNGLIQPNGTQCRFDGVYVIGQLDLTVSGYASAIGCIFSGSPPANILIATTHNIISGCQFPSAVNALTESGAADFNRYDSCDNLSGTIIGSNSKVDGASVVAKSGSTTGSFVSVFTVSAPFAGHLDGIGTLKNTGANPMEVRETVTDAFGTTDSATTPVPAGMDLPLDLRTNFGTARPPHGAYTVEVRHTGSATTYALKMQMRGGA